MTMQPIRLCLFAMIALASAVAVLSGATRATAQTKPKVVASFSILGDFVRNVGGDEVTIADLVGPNGDVHNYEPSPADARTIAQAKLLIINGLGFEGWLDRMIAASGRKLPTVIATKGIVPRKIEADHKLDPHAWQSVANAKIYVANVRDALIAIDPAHQASYSANGSSYLAQLDALDQEIKAVLAAVPRQQRRIVTNHDAFGYFADAYGVDLIPLQGTMIEAEPSARGVSEIIRKIREQKSGAIFLENIVNPALLKRIAEETGVKIGGTLYSDALTEPGGGAPTYIDLMRHNAQTIAAALKRGAN